MIKNIYCFKDRIEYIRLTGTAKVHSGRSRRYGTAGMSDVTAAEGFISYISE
jgi:hypothetical protein